MKIRLVPIGLASIFANTLFLGMISLGIYAIYLGIETILSSDILRGIIMALIGAFPVGLFGFAMVNYLHNHIILFDDKIVVKGDFIITKDTIQYPVEIKYNEIENVALISVNATNSLKKRLRTANAYASIAPLLYFEVTLKSGKTEWIFIRCFSKKQRVKILDMVNTKAGLNLSYSLLEEKDFSVFGKKKK